MFFDPLIILLGLEKSSQSVKIFLAGPNGALTLHAQSLKLKKKHGHITKTKALTTTTNPQYALMCLS